MATYSTFENDEQDRLKSLEALHLLDTPSEELFDRHTRLLQRVTKSPVTLFSLVDSNRTWFKSIQGSDISEAPRAGSFCHQLLTGEGNLIVNDASIDPRFTESPLVAGKPGFQAYAGIAIRDNNGLMLGTLALLDFHPREFSRDDLDMLEQVGAMVEYDIHLVQQSTLDPLTGLTNRKGFRDATCHILSLCNRSHCEATLLMFDLLNLDTVNQSHGHQAGDLVLKAFGKLLLETYRACDVISRVSGSQFTVLLSHGDNIDFIMPIRRFLRRLNEFNNALEAPDMIRASINYVHYDQQQHKTIDDMLSSTATRHKVDCEEVMASELTAS